MYNLDLKKKQKKREKINYGRDEPVGCFTQSLESSSRLITSLITSSDRIFNELLRVTSETPTGVMLRSIQAKDGKESKQAVHYTKLMYYIFHLLFFFF